ncbi:proline--tRNA ligase [Helicobacter sp. 13S00401-1]|uniref:proline--tRNA ligase n=1 Tax=Helicobacter sp. 13S00401-1 TaxID=1905758 RepID=UPI000BA5CE8F|nr:proline--tRNA ligase [Helicobacter sp. 13S00401-1]PAF50069.1 proline--tRNA ligase [Helicobacter sp. 13S00401-1]
MHFNEIFAFTTKEVPKDATLLSQQYLLRACFVQQIGSGIYNFLPLGKRVVDKIEAIVKEEMDKAGALEVSMGFLTPATLWQESGRYDFYGEELAVFKDRKDSEYVLGPTFEECVTSIAKAYIRSYKQLPLNLYQINLKFRDELRPRFGLLRAREFIMKDAYSFHSNKEDLGREFLNMQEAYRRIFTRLGLDFRIVDADSGAIGGSGSKEFMALANSGEDTVVVCDNCDYASNIEAARRAFKEAPSVPPHASSYHKFHTPNTNTIQAVADFFKIDPYFCIKALIYKVNLNDGSSDIAIFFMRGLDNLEETKALNALRRLDSRVLSIEVASLKFLESYNLVAGFCGPISIKHLTNSNFIVFDAELENASDLVAGANEKDHHYVGIDLSEFSGVTYDDLVLVQAGDKCPKCGGTLEYKKGIEVGHIFKLGSKYSAPLNANFLDENGKSAILEMGCYGIGVTRLLSVILEQKGDDKGCVWGNLAPFKLDIIISNIKNEEELQRGIEIYSMAKSLGIETVLDNRNERYGVKISDFELIGFTYALVVGKNLAENKVELITREGLIKELLDLDEVESFLKRIV